MFKKIGLVIVLFLLYLGGCQKKESVDDQQLRYNSLYEMLEKHEQFKTETALFSYEVQIEKMDDHYIYYVIVDEPKINMFDVAMLVIDNSNDQKKMYPNSGIFSDKIQSMVPSQINRSKGYIKGSILSGECSLDETSLKLLVSWKEVLGSSTTMYEFIQIDLSSLK